MVWIFVGAALLIGGTGLLPPLRRKRVMQEAEKLARSVTYTDSSADWPTLYRRISARYVGGQVGYTVGLVALWGFAGADPEYGSGCPPRRDRCELRHDCGEMGGTPVGRSPACTRTATGVPARTRESEDYLTPWELASIRGCALVPLAGLALGLGVASSGASAPGGMTGVGLVAISGAAPGPGRWVRTSWLGAPFVRPRT